MNHSPDLKDRVQNAVRGISTPQQLEVRIRKQISAPPRFRLWASWLIPVALAAVAAVLFLVPYQTGHFRLTHASRESYIASVSYRVATMMRVALGDHINCAVFRKFPSHPPAPAELVHDLGPEYQGLLQIVRDRVPAEYTLMMAHHCSYHDRQFVHLTWKNDPHLLSLMITRRNPGEQFDPAPALPPLQDSGIPIYRAGVQRFQITAFESGDFLVYFISDLPEHDNSAVMLALAPDIRNFLERRRGW